LGASGEACTTRSRAWGAELSFESEQAAVKATAAIRPRIPIRFIFVSPMNVGCLVIRLLRASSTVDA